MFTGAPNLTWPKVNWILHDTPTPISLFLSSKWQYHSSTCSNQKSRVHPWLLTSYPVLSICKSNWLSRIISPEPTSFHHLQDYHSSLTHHLCSEPQTASYRPALSPLRPVTFHHPHRAQSPRSSISSGHSKPSPIFPNPLSRKSTSPPWLRQAYRIGPAFLWLHLLLLLIHPTPTTGLPPGPL